MPLPPPCELCAPSGGNFRRKGNLGPGSCQRCSCPRGEALRAMDILRELPPTEADPQISEETAAAGVSMLSVMRYFPAEAGARLMIADELRQMCADVAQMAWLARRMSQLFSDWPGLPAMRAVFWSRYIPLDRRHALNEAAIFPDGVPSHAPAATDTKAIEPGSKDRDLDAAIRELAEKKRIM
jgi:hypothetical protein